jgi:hypothetical protein
MYSDEFRINYDSQEIIQDLRVKYLIEMSFQY